MCSSDLGKNLYMAKNETNVRVAGMIAATLVQMKSPVMAASGKSMSVDSLNKPRRYEELRVGKECSIRCGHDVVKKKIDMRIVYVCFIFSW